MCLTKDTTSSTLGAPGTRARRAARAEVHARAIGHDRVAGNPSLAPLPEERPETPEFDEITSIIPHMSFMGRPALYEYYHYVVRARTSLYKCRLYKLVRLVRTSSYKLVQACTSLFKLVQACTSACTSNGLYVQIRKYEYEIVRAYEQLVRARTSLYKPRTG